MNEQQTKTTKKNPARILPQKMLMVVKSVLDRAAVLFIRLRIQPNTITILALIMGLGAGTLFALGYPLWAGVSIIVCGFFDVMDGKVAISTNKQSLFGAIFDSALDRYSEFFIYLGLAVYFREHWALWITFWTFLGSTMVSYTRARAEGLGFDCKVGIMQRAERMTFLALGSFIGVIFNIFDPVIIAVLGIIAVISNVTAIQRTLYVRKCELLQKSKENRA